MISRKVERIVGCKCDRVERTVGSTVVESTVGSKCDPVPSRGQVEFVIKGTVTTSTEGSKWKG